MFLIDANILIAAHRADHPHHSPCRRWIEETLDGESQVRITEQVAIAFLRVVTHPAVFDPPSEARVALGVIDQILAQPEVDWLGVNEALMDALEEVLDDPGAGGRMAADSWLAAAAMANDATLVTLDRDFARYEGLRTLNPLG
jgi:uncharacterized protein